MPRGNRRLVWALVLLCVAFEVPALLADRADVEQYDYEYFSAYWQLKDAAAGRVNFWQDALGFGSPLPIGFNLTFHPALLAAGWLPDRAVLAGFQLLHLLIAVLFLNALLARLAVGRAARAGAVLFYLFLPPTIHYHYIEDWPGVLVVAGLLPVAVYLVERLVAASRPRDEWRGTIALGLTVGAMALWGHPSVVVIYLGVVAIYAALRVQARFRWRLLPMASAVAVIAAAIYAPELYRVLRHVGEFDPTLIRYSGESYHLAEWVLSSLRPIDAAARLGIPESILSGLYGTPRGAFMTFLFFPVVVSAIWHIGRGVKRWTWDAAAAASAAALIAMGLTAAPSAWFRNTLSASWLFRDPAIFFALIVAALTAERLWSAPRTPVIRVASAAFALTVVIGAVQGVYAASEVVSAHLARRSLAFRGEFGRSPFLQALRAAAPGEGLTIYPSEAVSERLIRRGGLRDGGLYGPSDLARAGYRNLVRRYFKGYSTRVFHDDAYYPYGQIPTVPLLIGRKASLDFFGVDLVILTEQELAAENEYRHVPRDLVYAGDYKVPATGERVLFYRNPSPLPMAMSFRPGTLPPVEKVAPDILVVGLWGPVVEQMLRDEPVAVRGDSGRYTLTLPPHAEDRVVLFRQWYRSEWRARGPAGGLDVAPLYRGFVGVTVPSGVTQISLEYRPAAVMRLWVGSLVTILGALGMLLWLGKRSAGPGTSPVSAAV